MIAIVGNGPSVTPEVLECLGCPTFGLNYVSGVYPLTTWRPSHYLYGCARFDHPDEPDFEKVRQSVALGIPSFVRDDWRAEITGDNVNYFRVRGMSFDQWPTSLDTLMQGGSAVVLAAQVAYLLGFTGFLFLGVDGLTVRKCGEPDVNHLTPEYSTYPPEVSTLQARMVNAHTRAGYSRMLAWLEHYGCSVRVVVPGDRVW